MRPPRITGEKMFAWVKITGAFEASMRPPRITGEKLVKITVTKTLLEELQ